MDNCKDFCSFHLDQLMDEQLVEEVMILTTAGAIADNIWGRIQDACMDLAAQDFCSTSGRDIRADELYNDAATIEQFVGDWVHEAVKGTDVKLALAVIEELRVRLKHISSEVFDRLKARWEGRL